MNMRLGQLARKIAVRPSDLVEFLDSRNIPTEEGTNTKLSDDEVRLITENLAPEKLDAVLQQNAPQPEERIEVAPVSVEEPAPVIETTEVVAEIEHTPEIQSAEPEPTEKPEVIKAPKVALAGLKVLGKIELPQPKKKEIAPVENTEVSPEVPATEQPQRDARPRREHKKEHARHKDRRENKPRKNPIALKREQEAREAEEKRREEAKRKKEERTNYYLERVKPSAPTKPARLYDEPVLEMKDHQTKKEPKTWLGKFWKWYRS